VAAVSKHWPYWSQTTTFQKTTPVPVLIVPADKALIASLAENCYRCKCNPACEGFSTKEMRCGGERDPHRTLLVVVVATIGLEKCQK